MKRDNELQDIHDQNERLAELLRVQEYQTGIIERFEERLRAVEEKVNPPIIEYGDGTLTNACQVCAIEWSGTMGYVCSRTDCPFGGSTSVDFPFGLNTGG